MTSSPLSNTEFAFSETLYSTSHSKHSQASASSPSAGEKESLGAEKVNSPKDKRGKHVYRKSVSLSRWELEEKVDAPWPTVNTFHSGNTQHSVGDAKAQEGLGGSEVYLDDIYCRKDMEDSAQLGFAGSCVGIGAEDLVGIGQQFTS